MIVSFRHRFVFVHLERTGGTSLHSALLPFLGPQDLVADQGRRARSVNGYHKHDPAREILRKLGERTWQSFFKFTFERNPWDKIRSLYHRGYTRSLAARGLKSWPQALWGGPLAFPTWFRARVWEARLLRAGHIRLPHDYAHYADGPDVLVDFVGRYEQRTQHLEFLSERLGLPIDAELRANNQRVDRRDRDQPPEPFDPWMLAQVQKYFATDLAFLGYRFQEPSPLAPAFDRENLADRTSPSDCTMRAQRRTAA